MSQKQIYISNIFLDKLNTIQRYKENFSLSIRNAIIKDIENEDFVFKDDIKKQSNKDFIKLLIKMRAKFNLKKQVAIELFNWCFKDGRRTQSDIDFYIKYLEEVKNNIDDKVWIDDCIIKIKSKDFDNLDIDISNSEEKLLYHLLKKKGYNSEQVNKIFKGVVFKEIKEEFVV